MGVAFQCLAIVLFVNRYIAGLILRAIRGKNWDEVDDTFEPTVTVIVPMYNEGSAIVETLESLVALNYPRHKLEIICTDDCSTDDSLAHAERVAAKSRGLVKIVRNRQN